jgi:hypothetical protein
MHGTLLVCWLLVLLGTGSGIVCLLRTGGRGSSGDEGFMGIGMAVMAVPASVLDLRPWGPGVLAVLFGTAALRALRQAGGRPGWSAHHVHHAVGTAAMAYMAAVMVPSGGPAEHAGHDHVGVPLLTGLLLAYFAAYVLAAGVRLVSVPAVAGQPGTAVLQAPELAAACRVSMAIGMFAMLLAL